MATGADNIIGNLQVDTFLTNYSESYIQDASTYISNAAATVIPVTAQAGSFVRYGRSYWLRDELEHRPLGGAPIQVRYGVERDSYYVDELAAEHFIDDRQRAQNALPATSLDQNATRLLTTKALIRRDRDWASTFFVPGVWNTEYQGVAATPAAGQFLQWDQAGADPIGDIARASDAIGLGTGKLPNTLVVGANVYSKLRLSPIIQEMIKYTQTPIVTADLLASLLGVERLVVARSVYNSADETANPNDTLNLQYIVDPNSVWLGFIERNPALDSPTAVALFVWTGLIPGLTNAQGGVISRGRDDRSYSDWFHIRDARQFKAVAPDLGAFLQNAVSGGL